MQSLIVIVGRSRSACAKAAADRLRPSRAAAPRVVRASAWTFARRIPEDLPPSGTALHLRALHEAYPAGQTGGTRLVLTQSAYQLQRVIDWMETAADAIVVADADADLLRDTAPEAFAARGPWAHVEMIHLADESDSADAAEPAVDGALHRAFRTTDPDERLALCRQYTEAFPDDAAGYLAIGSACMEVQDLGAASAALDRALTLAPDWEAAHYESGKLWLRRDDMERASRAFAEAARLMPSFAPAHSNLGATLGELGRPAEALAAFQHALRFDPNGHTILNNIGVVSRELGRLEDAVAAFRRAIATTPEFVFGHYNLGHALFLQGRYQAALSAYLEGQRRDPEKNPRQACRLAVVRLAAGDPEGARRDLLQYTAHLAADVKLDILSEAQEILWALLTTNPGLDGWRELSDMVAGELAALGGRRT